MEKVKLYFYDWVIIGIGIGLLFSPISAVGGIILGFMGCLYLTERLSDRKK
jgi:hypothetical protein